MRAMLPATVNLRPSGRRGLSAALSVALAAGTMVALGPGLAHAAATGFNAGDVVVYRVGDGSATLSGSGAPIFLDEYSPTGTLLASTPLPTTAAGPDKPIVASGSAASEGGLTLSADSRYLIATGYDAAVGTAGLSSSAAATVPRTIARVDGSGDVDSTTALTDFADGNNPRSAVSADGSEFWVGGAAGGVRYATLGASTSTSLTSSTYKNVRQLAIADGQLYASADPTKASLTVATVGTGLPTSGTQTVTNLPFSPAPVEPYSYSLLTLGTGTAPDTLYVADNSAGAVIKYGLSGGTWTQEGSVPVPGVTGLTANDTGGTVIIYATSSGSAGTSGTLYKITDASGIGGDLSGSAGIVAIAPSGEAFRGVAFAPGTVIGSGGGTSPGSPEPTISTTYSGLPAALGDPTNPTLPVTVADADFPASQLNVTVTSSDPAVAAPAGILLTGSDGGLTLSVTPSAVGYSTLTLTVTAPDGTSAETEVLYGVSANLGDPSQRYFSGAGNGSTAIDVGGGYMIVGDDEVNVLHLYNETQSGPPVASYDFTSELPYGTSSIDIESSARSGDMLYWTGSMTNTSSGDLAPSRSTLFAARITGSGANTQLTYVGSYTGLQSDLVNWDENDGSGLGANYFGFAASTQAGVDSHDADALDVEGMEFADSGGSVSSTTAYLAFRAPLEPTTARDLALVIPVTNIDQLVSDGNPGTTHATFGAPILMNLGGLGIREIRQNADGQYLILAGTPDGSNTSFVIYSWDGDPSDPPIQTGTSLPLEPAGVNQGSWETIVSVPDPLTAGANVQLLEDNGDTAWYGDTVTSKTGLNPDLQKDLGQVFTYVPATPLTTATALSTQPAAPTAGQQVTYTAVVTGPTGTLGTPTGTVAFTDGVNALAGCAAQPLDATGTATCTTTYPAAGSQTVSADYSGDGSFAASSSSSTLTIAPDEATVSLAASTASPVSGQDVSFTATVAAVAADEASGLTPTGTVDFQADGADLPGCSAVTLTTGTGATATCDVPAGFGASTQTVTAAYSGDPAFGAAAANPLSLVVTQDSTTTTLSSSADPAVAGQNVTFTAAVSATAPGSGTPTGSVVFTIDGAAQPAVPLTAGSAALTLATLAGGSHTVTAAYSGDGDFTASAAPALTQTVDQAPVTLSSSANPSASGQKVTFTAVVAPTKTGGATPTGTVTFTLDGVAQSPVKLHSGSATFKPSALAPGDHTLTAAYSGDSANPPVTSSVLNQIVNPATTTVSLTSSVNPSVTGQTTALAAVVAVVAPGAGTPTGTIVFTVDGAAQAPVTLGSGKATLKLATLAAGTHTVTVTYSGSASDQAGTSSPLTQTVDPAFTTTALTSSADPVADGKAVTFTASVKPVSPGTGTVNGSVVFTIDGVAQIPVTLASDKATLKLATLTPGAHTVTAQYTGASGYASSASGTLTETVNPPSTAAVAQLQPFGLWGLFGEFFPWEVG